MKRLDKEIYNMTPTLLFYIIIAILIIKYLFDQFLNFQNAKHFEDAIPMELQGIYDDEAYQKSQRYKKVNFKFGTITGAFSIVVTLLFFFFNGFAFVHELATSFTSNTILVTLYFFGIIFFASDVINTPFSYYKIFVIEENFGFNKSTKATFVLDKLKGWLMAIILGGALLSLLTWFYETTTDNFWWYSWILIGGFTIFMNMFYSKLIVPIFNKQTPLEDGALKDSIFNFASKTGFKLDNIFVINGSKRSTKANAYFSGFGSQKRITLYDTLINDLENDEIVAVLAHEVGHYKRNHIVYNMVLSLIITGITLFLLSIMLKSSLLSEALGVSGTSFHMGLIAFSVLYSPISEITGFFMNILSRKFEYEADDFAKNNFAGQPLIDALKKLSKNSLSNLTPSKLYVKVHYSHPTLYQRIVNLKQQP